MSEIRVAVVDDERLFCDGVRMMVESQPDMRFTGAAHDGEAAITLVQRERPDVVLMDVRMPELNGIAATARILEAAGADAPAVLVLTTLRSDEAVAAATRAGAAGFLLKDTTAETLLDAVRTVHAGQSVFEPRPSTEVLRESREAARTPEVDALDPLTPRERQVFLYAARGLSNAQIATIAFISETTVKSHVSHILTKLGMRSRLQLIAFALDRGLIR
ncbi:response regulator transcription factor [Microbacterium tumbae]